MKAEPCPFHGTMCEFVTVARSSEELRAEVSRLTAELAQYQTEAARSFVEAALDYAYSYAHHSNDAGRSSLERAALNFGRERLAARVE